MSEILQFKVESGKICISDPCYNKGTLCAAWDLDAINGVWNCEVIREDHGLGGGVRIKEINAISAEIYPEGCIPIDLPWQKLEFDIGVDSGQCGIFDYEKYPDGETGECGDLDTFYGKCCEFTLKEDFGTLENGIVSSSGFGDGSYTAYGIYDEKREKLIGVKVIFIDDEYLEDDEDYDGCDCCEDCHACDVIDEEEDKNEEENIVCDE